MKPHSPKQKKYPAHDITLIADFPDTHKLTGQDEVSKAYSFLKSYVSYRKPKTVSAKQRERAMQMMFERNKAKEN